MDRAALARDLDDVFHAMRGEIGSLKLEAGLAADDFCGVVAAGAARLTLLVEQAENVVQGYLSSAGSGAHRGQT